MSAAETEMRTLFTDLEVGKPIKATLQNGVAVFLELQKKSGRKARIAIRSSCDASNEDRKASKEVKAAQ